MQQPFQFISYEKAGEVFCVRLQNKRIEDHQIQELGAEFSRLIDQDHCRKMVINLGPDEPECLISVFLAKLISLQRRLASMGGVLALAHVSDDTREIFRVAGIERFFQFHPDQQAAVQALDAGNA